MYLEKLEKIICTICHAHICRWIVCIRISKALSAALSMLAKRKKIILTSQTKEENNVYIKHLLCVGNTLDFVIYGSTSLSINAL